MTEAAFRIDRCSIHAADPDSLVVALIHSVCHLCGVQVFLKLEAIIRVMMQMNCDLTTVHADCSSQFSK
jgi:hypothetical protein